MLDFVTKAGFFLLVFNLVLGGLTNARQSDNEFLEEINRLSNQTSDETTGLTGVSIFSWLTIVKAANLFLKTIKYVFLTGSLISNLLVINGVKLMPAWLEHTLNIICSFCVVVALSQLLRGLRW